MRVFSPYGYGEKTVLISSIFKKTKIHTSDISHAWYYGPFLKGTGRVLIKTNASFGYWHAISDNENKLYEFLKENGVKMKVPWFWF